jgi:hypothetical protein
MERGPVSKKARVQSRIQRKLAEVQRQQRTRQRRIRILIGVPSAIVVVAVVAVLAVLFAGTHSPGSGPAGSAMAAAEKTGASGLTGPVLAGLDSAAQGSRVNGIQCSSSEQTVYHIHAHLAVYVNGARQTIPYGVGIPGGTAQNYNGLQYVGSGSCFYWLHTHDQTGVIHIESPVQKLYTLGDFFAILGQPLTAGEVGPAATGTLTVYVDGKRYAGDPASITLTAHKLIQIDVGKDVPPQAFTFPAGL